MTLAGATRINDIQSFFDRVDQDLLLRRLEERRLGPALMGLLRQWVHPQVWDGSHVHALHQGVPQGSPISPLLANFFLEEFDTELEKSGRKLVRYADDFLILAKSEDEARQALVQTSDELARAHLALNRDKTRITDFDHGFRFLGALFEGDGIWVPWKNERKKGRVLFMAPPMPVWMRPRYEFAPPRSTLEVALERAGLPDAEPLPESAFNRKDTDVAYLYLTEQGSILRKAGDRFLVEKEDEVVLDLPYHKLENVLLFGNVQVTTQAMGELLEKGVNLSLFSRQGTYRGALAAPRGRNIELRIAQFDRYRDAPQALAVAKAVVTAKIRNGLAVLARFEERKEVAEGHAERRQQMENGLKTAEASADVSALDGVEGAAARAYFELLMEFNTSGMEWPGRRKHPATDPLNALLSLAYTLVMNELAALLEGMGLDPYLGFLHQPDYGRPSLALDLMEPFRHPLADRLVLTLVNRSVIGADDFRSGGERPGVFLAPAPMKRFFAEYERWMLDRPRRAEDAPPPPRWRDRLKNEVERLAAALRSGGQFEPFLFDQLDKEEECSTSSVTI